MAVSIRLAFVFLLTATIAQQSSLPDISPQDLLDGLKNPSRWLMYSGDYTGRRHSPLTQITPENVSGLSPQWTFQADMPPGRGFEATPLSVDGVLYITGNRNIAWAVDARTGRQIWRYARELPSGLTYGGGNIVNRGFAILGDRLFMGTLDAHLIALDRRDGKVLWDVVLDDFKLGHAATVSPLVVKDKVIIGNAGGDMASRGFLDAYDAKTGSRVWRFYTIPAPGEPGSETWSSSDVLPRGGGAMWVTGSYDPELNLIYWGAGNPNPNYYGDDRIGDNLFTASLVALDADTGKKRWHYQFTPHDTHDWDANQIPILGDLTIRGQRRKVVMDANRNGFFYTLDRATGELLVAKPFTNTQWAREIGPDGRPIVLNLGVAAADPNARPMCVPDLRGGTNFNPPSYDPALELFFVMARESCALYTPQKTDVQPGRLTNGGTMRSLPDPSFSALRALDPKTGEMRWEYKFPSLSLAGVMSTASGLIFAGDNEGNLNAFESRSGKRLWSHATGAPIYGAAATTHMLDGRQFVLIPTGTKLLAFALQEAPQPRAGQYLQADVEAGYNLYNTNCITCHGVNGDSVPGVNLRGGQFRRASSDADLNRLIQTGIPGTAMPPGKFNTGELAGLVAYIRSLREFDSRPARGDAGRGRVIFEGKGGCADCHRVDGKGSRVAPDLSDIGAIRSPEALERSLIDPTANMLPVNRYVRAVTRDGTVVTGRRLNEDTYTVQLIDSNQRLVSLEKAGLREFTVLKTSAMPSYKDKLTSSEFDDVVAYLRTLKGSR